MPLSPNEFCLLRAARDVIQGASMTVPLLHLPAPERTCPIEDVFYRRAGMRVVNREREMAIHRES